MPDSYLVVHKGHTRSAGTFLAATKIAKNGDTLYAVYSDGTTQKIGHMEDKRFVDDTGWNPQRKHLTGKVSAKAQRAYEHILASGERYGKRAKEVAARTVRKMMSEGMINPSQVEEGMWVVEDAKGQTLGVYPKDWTEEAVGEAGQGFADQYKEHVIVMKKGEEFEHAHFFPKGKRSTSNPAISQMTAGQINKALDKLDEQRSKLTDEFIEAGRGHERPSEYLKANDPLSRRAQELHRKRMDLQIEVERRYGPGAPSRLPKGFGPIGGRQKNPSSLADAKALAERWHGRPAEEIFEVVEKEIYDTNLAVLGELVELTLIDEDGYGTPIKFDKSVLLVGTVDENNMEFVGGDQKLPLEDLGVESNKHKVNCGQVFSIVYFTDKQHLQGEPKSAIERVHEFNEESKDGNYPELVYDTRNKHMELVGGSYIVTEEGIRD